MTLTYGTETECFDVDGSTFDGGRPMACHGELELTVSKSGATRVMRCAAHARQYHDAMDALEARVQSRYPGYDNPHSSPPRWFDSMNAGERWDEDDPWP
jgi:hypothetical protein